MFEVIIGVSSFALAFGCYCYGLARGREEGRGERAMLDRENRSLRFGGAEVDAFRVRSNPSGRRIYQGRSL